jgi:response regulator RpfG family c-di-GMP phosphodiesterase
MDIEAIKKLKVLYVEDELVLRDTTCNSLHSIINDIIVADNGKEGLDKFKNDTFDLIITDLSMPSMTGTDMLKEIIKIKPNIPVVVTTAYGSQNKDITILKDMGIKEFVMKPVDIMKLVTSIDKVIK